MASLTIEKYVKAIFQICSAEGETLATTGQLAETLGVLPGTVTSMLKTLQTAGLVKYEPYEGAVLTEAGVGLALRVVRRHRLIELFLTRTLKLNWDEVHAEAENMEHAVSEMLVEKIDAYLGFPKFDPHGDPIPSADGKIHDIQARPLCELATGSKFRVARVVDQSPEFLRYLSESGIAIESHGCVTQNRPQSGIISFQIGESPITLASQIAEKLLVAPIGADA